MCRWTPGYFETSPESSEITKRGRFGFISSGKVLICLLSRFSSSFTSLLQSFMEWLKGDDVISGDSIVGFSSTEFGIKLKRAYDPKSIRNAALLMHYCCEVRSKPTICPTTLSGHIDIKYTVIKCEINWPFLRKNFFNIVRWKSFIWYKNFFCFRKITSKVSLWRLIQCCERNYWWQYPLFNVFHFYFFIFQK